MKYGGCGGMVRYCFGSLGAQDGGGGVSPVQFKSYGVEADTHTSKSNDERADLRGFSGCLLCVCVRQRGGVSFPKPKNGDWATRGKPQLKKKRKLKRQVTIQNTKARKSQSHRHTGTSHPTEERFSFLPLYFLPHYTPFLLHSESAHLPTTNPIKKHNTGQPTQPTMPSSPRARRASSSRAAEAAGEAQHAQGKRQGGRPLEQSPSRPGASPGKKML